MIDWSRFIAAGAAGACIGLAAVLALSLTWRLLARDRTPASPAVMRFAWGAKVSIIMIATAAYAWIGYGRLAAPTAIAPQPAPAPSDAAEQASPLQPQPPQEPQPAAEATPLAPGAAAAAAIDLGGVAVAFDPPPGYCVFPQPMMAAAVARQGRLDPGDVLHVAFGDCDQLRAAAASNTRVKDFGLLMSPKSQLGRPIDRAGLDRLAANAGDPVTVKQTIDQRLRQAQTSLKLQSFSALGTIDSDDRSIYLGFLSKAEGASGPFAQAGVMAMTAVKGRLVSYYLYSDYDRDARSALLALLQKVKTGVAGLAERNG